MNAPYQLIGGTATLTATTLSDVGPTPYFIEIFDQTTGKRIGVPCGTGTSCSASQSYPYATTHSYIAYIASSGTTNPPPNVQWTSAPITVTWQAPLVLNATTTSVQGGQSSKLTASSTINVGPTPWYIEIFDQSTGAALAQCGWSTTTCSASVSYGYPTTHTYIAYIASYSNTNPPPNIQATSNTVSVTWWVLH